MIQPTLRLVGNLVGNKGNKTVVKIQQSLQKSDLLKGLLRGEFTLLYQPQVSLTSGKIVGAEALLRWNSPIFGQVSPQQFIPLAEANGAIHQIDRWVLTTACSALKRWQDRGLPKVLLCINLSANQLIQPHCVATVAEILAQTGCDPKQIEIELTETSPIADNETAIANLHQLKALGLSIAIDDFGTGYASLQYLQKFCFDTLKIDRTFVQDVDNNPSTAAFALSILDLAAKRNLRTVAEGVETAAELAWLHQQGCHTIQGYLFARPMSETQFQEWLANGQHLSLPKPKLSIKQIITKQNLPSEIISSHSTQIYAENPGHKNSLPETPTQFSASSALKLQNLSISTLKVIGYEAGANDYKRKLLAMGLIPGTEFFVKRYAPLGDPIEIEVRGFNLSLRKDEADVLIVQPV
jgi:EAL domain-containing protein (putative c-di-GMP-specific phosphodiesterase class I)/Fe2+ transport system protein FeoA